jgi:hydroxymethylglutaryl-CoA reductase
MTKNRIINGFSRLTRDEKIELISEFIDDPYTFKADIASFWHQDLEIQQLFEEFGENTISNFFMPYGIAPNLMVNGKSYLVPMVIEESSVIAAASNSAKWWANQGGFKAEIVSTKKIGQVHFIWYGPKEKLQAIMPELKIKLKKDTRELTANMEKRGGGILEIDLVDMTDKLDGYYQLKSTFETVDAMGANFINSVLEEFGKTLKRYILCHRGFERNEKEVQVVMAILSNYTPECLVKCWVECDIDVMHDMQEDMTANEFVERFERAVMIAQVDPHRATTHNKGIFNGIDAVALATGNDFRAIEACGHTYASRDGKYTSLTNVRIEDGKFRYELIIPLAMGTVGGLTSLHPLAKRSLELLGNPSAKELMMITAAVGLANNFGALRSLVTSGIQKGHMKMHLLNILNHFMASDKEKDKAYEFFKKNKVSFSSVEKFIHDLRTDQ